MITSGRTHYLPIPKRESPTVVVLLYAHVAWILRLPAYEASHEFDKRGRRNNLPPQHARPPPDHVRPALQHGHGFYGHPPGHRPSRGGRPPPVMFTALMQQGHVPPGAGVPMGSGYGHPPPALYGQPGPGMPPVNGFAAQPPQGHPPPLSHGHGYGHGHDGRYHPSDRGERGERGGTSRPPLHSSLPSKPVGLPDKPPAPLGTGGGRYEREKDKDRSRDRDRDRGRERARYGGPVAGGGRGGGNEADGGGLSGGLPYS